MFISTPLVGLAANERRTKHHSKAAKGGRLFMWMGRPERIEDDIALVMMRIERSIELFMVFADSFLSRLLRQSGSIVMA